MKPGQVLHLTGAVTSHGHSVTQTVGLTKDTHLTVLVLGITPGAAPTGDEVLRILVRAGVEMNRVVL